MDGGDPGFNDPDRFRRRYDLLGNLQAATALTGAPQRSQELASFRSQARRLMLNNDVNNVFTFTAGDHERYGSTGFGDACLVTRKLLRADLGVRFVHITSGAGGAWDQHSNIYTDPNGGIIPVATELDMGLGSLLADLQFDGLLDSTLVVWLGEFGRTTGSLNTEGGRDHHLQQFAGFAGGGVRGGRTIGATDAAGEDIADFGWSGNEPIHFEHIAATIYSALGIDYTTKLVDDPTGRGFEYVPGALHGAYAPINELFR
jgi:hypothetical protein